MRTLESVLVGHSGTEEQVVPQSGISQKNASQIRFATDHLSDFVHEQYVVDFERIARSPIESFPSLLIDFFDVCYHVLFTGK